MTNAHDQPERQAAADQHNHKRPYLKPAFRHEAVFEVMALACGKIGGTSSACNRNRKNS